MARRSKNWQDRRRRRKPDDTDVLARIHTVIGDLPTYGYRRVWALLRRQSETDDMAVINAKRVYRIMRQNALLLERKPAIPPSKRAHTGKWPLGKVTSGGALTALGPAVITAKNCGSRSHWTTAIVKHCTGRPVTVDMTAKPYRT
jgi:putative transposase